MEHIQFNGELSVDRTVDTTAPNAPTPEAAASIGGRVVEARSGRALAGLTLVAFSGSLDLGKAVSDGAGGFQIAFEDSGAVRERILALQHVPDSTLQLRVEGDGGAQLYTSPAMRLDPAQLRVTLPVTFPPDTNSYIDWGGFSEKLVQARIARVSDAVAALAADRSIPLATRQAMLDAMERAFLDSKNILAQVGGEVPTLADLQDPTTVAQYRSRLGDHLQNPEVQGAYSEMIGKAASFPSLSAVDWTFDPAGLAQDLGGALNKFSDQYKAGYVVGRLRPQHQSDLTRYRDYLVAIWTTTAGLVPAQPANVVGMHGWNLRQRRRSRRTS